MAEEINIKKKKDNDMKNNLLRTGYVMISRALLMNIYEKQGAALTDEEAFLRVLLCVNYKETVTMCSGVQVTCARGESVIAFTGWADILGWTRGRTRGFFDRYMAAKQIEPVPDSCPSHIRIPGYDAWTGHAAGTTKPESPAKAKPADLLDESLQCFIDRYSEVTHLPAEHKGRLRGIWKKLSSHERETALLRIEDYYYGLNNTNYCYQAAKYLEYKAFDAVAS